MALAIFLILLFGTWSVKYNLEDLDVGDYEKVHRCRDFVALFTGVKPKFVSHDLPPSSWVRWILPLKNSQIFFERIGNKGEIIHHPDAGGPNMHRWPRIPRPYWPALQREELGNWSEGFEKCTSETYQTFLSGDFKQLLFSSLFGEMIPIDPYFSNGLKPPTRFDLPSLKLTAKAPENGWLEYDRFLLGWRNLAGANC